MKALLLLLSAAKLGKLLSSGGTMILSLAVYAAMWGLPYAAGFIGLLLIHELGHVYAARQRGVDVTLPMFIPFVGAWITLKEQPVDAETEAYIALGGPVAGTIAAVLVYFWSRSTDSSLLLAVAYSGLFLNLFNLLPVSPLDGGRITGVISPRIWLLGAPVLVALFFYRPSPVLLMIGILSIPQLLHAWSYNPNAPENQRYRAVPAKTKFEYAAAYLFLTFFLALMTFDVHEMLEHTRNLHR